MVLWVFLFLWNCVCVGNRIVQTVYERKVVYSVDLRSTLGSSPLLSVPILVPFIFRHEQPVPGYLAGDLVDDLVNDLAGDLA